MELAWAQMIINQTRHHALESWTDLAKASQGKWSSRFIDNSLILVEMVLLWYIYIFQCLSFFKILIFNFDTTWKFWFNYSSLLLETIVILSIYTSDLFGWKIFPKNIWLQKLKKEIFHCKFPIFKKNSPNFQDFSLFK
jgi:hypothetical protein